MREDYKHLVTMTAQQHQGMRDLVAKMKSKGIDQALIDAMLSNDPDEGTKKIVTVRFCYHSGDVTISKKKACHWRSATTCDAGSIFSR